MTTWRACRGVGVLMMLVVGLGCGVCFTAHAADGQSPAADVLVEARALPGMPVDPQTASGEVWLLTASALSAAGNAIGDALSSRVAAVSVEDSVSDRFQPSLSFHGFSASPVLGAPQGLAVYQDGVRINEAFGDVVNWDLVPMFAMRALELVGANPVYGANALGGAVVIAMKDGSTDPGIRVEAGTGSFGEHHGVFEFGARHDDLSVYVGGEGLDERGFREYSDNALRRAYLAGTWHGSRGALSLSMTLANNALNGPGASPVQEIAISRALTFTGPQQTEDRLVFTRLHGEWQWTESSSVSATIYDRHLSQTLTNGNTTSYIGCRLPDEQGLLCQPDGSTVLHTVLGAAIPDYSDAGSVPIGENDQASQVADTLGLAAQWSGRWHLAGGEHAVSFGVTEDNARVHFRSVAEVAALLSGLQVSPQGSLVDSPEGTGFVNTPVKLVANDQTFSAYATDAVSLTRSVSLHASARWGHESVALSDQGGTALSGQNVYARLNPALGLGYQVTPRALAYVGLADTSRAPSASEIECSDPTRPCALPSTLAGDPPLLRQVVAHTAELGLRVSNGDVDIEGFTGQIGLFRTNLANDIYTVATSTGTGYYRNIGATRREGFTANLDYNAAFGRLYLSVAEVNARFESAFKIASPQNPFADESGNLAVTSGDHMPGIPRWRLVAGGELKLTSKVQVGLSDAYSGPTFLHGDESNQTTPLGGYSRVDLHVRWAVSSRIQLSLGVANLLNKRYATSGLYADPSGVGAPGVPQASAAVNPRFEVPGSPFAASMVFRMQF